MAIDFPNSPTTGDTYTAGGRTWQWDGTVWASYGNYPDPTVLKIDTGTNRVGINNTSPTTALDVTGDLTVSGTITGGSISGAGMTVSSSAPSSPSAGEMWYNDTTGRTFVYYNDGSSQQWVEFGVPPEGSTIALASYADAAARTTAIPSPTEADLSYLQDTNSVEVYDGSAWTAVGAGGLVHISRTTIGTAVSSVAITNCFSADYDSYLMVIQGGAGSTNISLQAVIGGTASGYRWAGWYSEFLNSVLAAQRGAGIAYFPVGKASTAGINGRVVINSPFLNEYTTYISEYHIILTSGDTSYIAGYGPDSSSDTDITISTNTGTITGGTIDIYGYAKA